MQTPKPHLWEINAFCFNSDLCISIAAQFSESDPNPVLEPALMITC